MSVMDILRLYGFHQYLLPTCILIEYPLRKKMFYVFYFLIAIAITGQNVYDKINDRNQLKTFWNYKKR